MRAVGYPELDSHIELHVALARRVEEYKAAFERQAARFDFNGFTAFLTDHILHEDMQFAKYIIGNNRVLCSRCIPEKPCVKARCEAVATLKRA